MHPIELITPTSLPPTTPPRGRRWLDRCLTAAMLTCFVLGGWFWSQQPTSDAAIQPPSKPIARAKLIPAKLEQMLLTRSIEEVQLGQRLVGKNPLRHETSLPSNIHPEAWRAIRLTMTQDGVRYDLAFLRSFDWLSDAGAAEGGTIDLHMPEMGLTGPALVESISACPPLEPDDGSGRMVVTGTMAHFADNVLDIEITGLDEPLGVTTTHPIWSEDRQDFIPAAQLRIGEHLQSSAGTLTQVTRITPRRGPPEVVYNLEVDAEHVYRVGSPGLLVHNVCPWDIGYSRPVEAGEMFSKGPWAGKTVEEAIEAARREGKLPEGLTLNAGKINGEWVTANNRTLYVAQQAGLSHIHPVTGSGTMKSIETHLRDSGLIVPLFR